MNSYYIHMIIKEFEKILDYRCEIRLSLEEDLKELSGLKIAALGRIRHKKEGGFFVVTAPSMEHEGSGHKSYIFNVSNTKVYEIHKQLMELNSTIVDAVLVKNDEVSIFFRFHRFEAESINKILMKYSREVEGLRLIFLGEANGILDSYRKIANVGDVHYVELSSSIPPELMKIYGDPIIMSFGTTWNRQVRKIGDNEIRALFKDKHNLLKESKEIRKISEEDHIYESIFSNELISYFAKKMEEAKTPILGIPQKLTGKEFIFGFFIPSCCLADFMRVISDAYGNYPKWNISIRFSDVIEKKEN